MTGPPENVEEAVPDYLGSATEKLMHYEERYLVVEFETAICPECCKEVRLRKETDTYRAVERFDCPDCGRVEP